ncbi:MAG: hypothetical protein MAGBODY4_01299 [Candidatus Marinimicrobia bacterium]|nr:hypothetical protein [Candidatus Neomarinimicrobiota bacterium]
MNIVRVTAGLLMLVFASSGLAQKDQLLSEEQILQIITSLQERYTEINGYTCTFYKQERIDGEMNPRETIFMKFRKPFQLYMKWIEDPYQGRELLYKKGWNEEKVRVRQHSFPYLTVNVSPTGGLAMKGNRHPVTEAGLGNTIDIIVSDYQRGQSRPADTVRYFDRGTDTLYDEKVRCIEAVMPKDPESGYYSHRALICISKKTNLPVQVKIWDATNTLVENYGYANIQMNPGLTNEDFFPENPENKF